MHVVHYAIGGHNVRARCHQIVVGFEFAEYFPRALKVVDQRALNRMGVRMADMVEVFRAVYLEGFLRAAVVQLEELGAERKRDA